MAYRLNIVLFIALVYCVAQVYSQAPPLVGGLEDEKPADDHVKNVISTVKSQIQSKYPREYVNIEPVSYRTQVVAGMNYFIRAIVTEKSGAKSHIHLRVYKPFRGTNELTAIKTDVTKDQPLKYFQ